MDSERVGSVTSAMDDIGMRVAGLRWTKSKMPCPPGSIPVVTLDQATGLCGGMVVARRLKSPCCAGVSEVRQRRPVRFQELRIHAVDAEHDHLLAGGSHVG